MKDAKSKVAEIIYLYHRQAALSNGITLMHYNDENFHHKNDEKKKY